MSVSAERARRSAPLSAARLAAVQALYQMDISGIDTSHVIAEFRDHKLATDVEGIELYPADPDLFSDLVNGIVANQGHIDPLIGACLSEGWRLARIDSIMRAILRAAAYELLERLHVPAKVIINEYLEVAHAFFAGDEPGVVNGILDRLARQHREKEFGDTTNA